ncbi:MAG: 50S ribosomal protein L24 [Spirochaetes bacterium]|nr:50S ribosomal protein L24 [Spirochaetota bacterium]
MPKKYSKKAATRALNAGVKFKIRKGDNVQVISGQYKGKQGEVLSVDRSLGKVVVKNVNMMKKTVQKSQKHQKGGIIEKEAPMAIGKVMLLSSKLNKPVRIGRKLVDGVLKRFDKKSGELLDK